ncbi:M23 family metallopeptidase [Myxococcota bacterium]
MWRLTVAVCLSAAGNALAESTPAMPGADGLVPVFHEVRDGIALWRPLSVQQGRLLVVELTIGRACDELSVTWLGARFPTHAVAGRSQALLPVTLGIPTGRRTLWVECDGKRTRFRVPVTSFERVQEASPLRPPFAQSGGRLWVAKKFMATPPPRTRREIAAISAVWMSSRTERLWSQSFLRPAAGPETSQFGQKRTYNGKVQSTHRGLDVDGTAVDPVYATNSGVVALVADRYFYVGNAIFIDHGEQLFSAYFHLDRTYVEKGAVVERGQLIATIGETGRVTGPHLHFAIKYAGQYIDPKALLSYRPGERLPFSIDGEILRPQRTPHLYARPVSEEPQSPTALVSRK